MIGKVGMVALYSACLVSGIVIDRIAIVIGNSIIKDSDINRDVRVTEFLNQQPLSLSNDARRGAANRLIDQEFIREEIQTGDYPTASRDDADKQLSALERQRFSGNAALERGLARYGLTELNLRLQFQWQLTVLRFIDARFRPAAYVSDEEITNYFNQHKPELTRQYPGKQTLDDLRGRITDTIEQEKTNRLFFSWLDDQRKQAKILYHEPSLQ